MNHELLMELCFDTGTCFRKMTAKTRGRPWLTVEPILLCVTLTLNLFNSDVSRSWLSTQSRWFDVGPGTVCEDYEERRSMKLAGTLETMQTLMIWVIPSIMGILMSSKWSHVNRKILITIPLLGQLSMWASLCVFAKFQIGHPILTIFASFLSTATGGFVGSVAACLCYVSDVATPGTAALRFGICASMDMIAKLILIFVKSNLVDEISFCYLFLTCAVAVSVALFYTAFLLPENDFNQKLKYKLSQLNISTLTRERPTRPSAKLGVLLTVALASMSSLYTSGEWDRLYEAIRGKFIWSRHEFVTFTASYYSLCGFWLTVGVWLFSNFMKIRDFFTMIILFTVIGLSSVLTAQATSLHSFIVASGVGSMLLVPSAIYKSFAISLVDKRKSAVVVSWIVFSEALASELGPWTYEHARDLIATNDPMFIFYLKAGFCAIGLVILRIIYSIGESQSDCVNLITRPTQLQPVFDQDVWMVDQSDYFSKSTLSLRINDEKTSLVAEK